MSLLLFLRDRWQPCPHACPPATAAAAMVEAAATTGATAATGVAATGGVAAAACAKVLGFDRQQQCPAGLGSGRDLYGRAGATCVGYGGWAMSFLLGLRVRELLRETE